MPIVDEIVDLSVPLYEGMPTDDLGPKFWVRLSHAASGQIYSNHHTREGRVFLTTDHVGTHLDGPLRFDPQGASIEQVPLERFILPARLLDLRAVPRGGQIGPAELQAAAGELAPGEAAVLWTGHDRHLPAPDYFWHRPELSLEGAAWLVERRVGLVAADFPGLGRPSDPNFAVKRALHRGDVLTAEQLCNLGALAGKRWHLSVAPIRIRGVAGSLVRAVGLVNWRAREIVDLSLDIFIGMPALGGASPTFWTRANHKLTATFHPDGLSYQTNSLFLSEHAGTHIDSPFHFDPDGPALEAMDLNGLLARARIFDLTHKRALEGIGAEDLEAAARRDGVAVAPGEASVVWTEHSRSFGREDYTYNRPFITKDGADWIARQGPGMVVTDLVGLDEFVDLTSPVHNRILRAGIPQLQVTQNVARLVGREAYIAAFPLKLVGGTGSPVRAFAALA